MPVNITPTLANAVNQRAVFELQLAGQTHPGDVYVTAVARRVLCPNLPDSDSRPAPG